ncbi:MAG: hypothetical protein ACT4OV_07270 [Microthrixaceae bacterium]
MDANDPGGAADPTAIAETRPSRGLAHKARLVGVLLVGLVAASTGLARADALPDSVQHVAHTALGQVGVDVPDPARYHGPECGEEVKRNHGAYVSEDHSLAKTDCGKKIKAVSDEDGTEDESGAKDKDGTKNDSSDEPADKGPCHGKPSWAKDKSSTAEAKAAAKAARAAACGDTDEPDAEPDDEAPDAG